MSDVRRLGTAAVVVALAVVSGCATEPAEPLVERFGLVALINRSADTTDLFTGQFCGAVLTGPAEVVTAAHCVADRTAETIDVAVGADDLCGRPPATLERRPVAAIEEPRGLHPSLRRLRLAAAVSYRPIAVATTAPVAGEQVVAAGWGTQSLAGVPACQGREVTLTVTGSGRCDALTAALEAGPEPATTVCTIPEGKVNTCGGDSGGPVVTTGGDRPRLVAVTMSGEGCGPSDAGLNVGLGSG